MVDVDYNNLNKYKTVQLGAKVAIIGAGNFFELGKNVSDKLKEKNITPTLINPRYLTGIDEKCLNDLKEQHQLVVTLEDGELDGGFGEKIARFFGVSDMKVLNYGSLKEFSDRVSVQNLYQKYHLTPDQITEDILTVLNQK